MEKMKMLYISTKLPDGKPYHYGGKEKAIIEANWNLKAFPYRYILKDTNNDTRILNQLLIRMATKFKPNVLLMEKCGPIDADALQKIKSVIPKVKILMWYGDYREVIYHEIGKRKNILDALLITNSQQIDFYKKIGIREVIEWHCAGEIFEDMIGKPVKQEFDVVFGGNCYRGLPNSSLRNTLINILMRNFKFHIFGNGWSGNVSSSFLSNTKQYLYNLRRGKITIGINNFDAKNYYNRRLFENMAAGRLHITYYSPNMERDFKDKQHLVWFNDMSKIVGIIRYYLRHNSEREKIAQQGFDIIKKNHTWTKRYEELKEIVKKLPEDIISVNIQRSQKYRIEFPLVGNQKDKVAIVVPVRNAENYMKKCILSIIKNTYYPYQLIIVDDSSGVKVKSILRSWKSHIPFILFQTSKQRGFPYSCNVGMHYAYKCGFKYICLLNSDTYLVPGWLQKLVSCANIHSNYGVLSTRTCMSASLQCMRNLIPRRGKMKESEMVRVSDNLWKRYKTGIRKTEVSGFCYFIKKEVIKSIGYFDLRFGLGYGEESDYNMRARNAGFNVGFCQGVYVHHYGRQSFNHKERGGSVRNQKLLRKRVQDGFYKIKENLYYKFGV